jgi:Glycosyl transferases group 1/Heparinase II/III N-terminus
MTWGPSGTARCASSESGASWRRSFDTLVDACGVLQRQGVPFEAAIIGRDDKHADEIRRRIHGQGLDELIRLPGPVGQAELLDEYRRASALCMPCRLLPNDRDGIPNVFVEAMAAGAPVVAPRPVLAVTAHEHENLERAEAVTQGRFELNGQTLTLGTEPDWLDADLPADEEWRIEWVKFAYGNDLAHAYEHTGELHYLATLELLVGSWIRHVPPDHDAAEVTARRIVNWIYAWQAFAAAGAELPPGLDAALLGSLARESATCARTSPRSATTERSSSTPC